MLQNLAGHRAEGALEIRVYTPQVMNKENDIQAIEETSLP